MIKIKKIFILSLIFSLSFFKVNAEIKDKLFLTVGNKAVTTLDVMNEIKVILILNNMSYDDQKREELHKMAITSLIKRSVKEIEINKHDFLEYNENDYINELTKLANNINMDLETLKKICNSNELDFSIVQNQMKTELLWNSLIFYLYKNRISINLNEIDEQLKLSQNKKEIEEFLISEIILKRVENDKVKSRIEEIINQIETEGFEAVAMKSSISSSATKGGDLGWLNENQISKKFRSNITNTPVGSLAEPILLNEGILIFKLRDKRKIKNETDLEILKNQLVTTEKTKILNMYSTSHYDRLRRSVSIKFFDE